MKLRILFFLALCGTTACFQATGESAPVAELTALSSPTPNKSIISAAQIVPLLELNSGGLLGGVKNGQWMRAKDVAGEMRGGEQYKFYDVTAATSTERIGEVPTNDATCEDFYSVTVKNSPKDAGGVGFGASLSWNPLARPLKKITANSPIYAKIAGDVLKSKGLTNAVPKINAIYQTDLDGDGQDEIILNASYFKNGLSSKAAIGDYSFVLLRKVVNEKAENLVLDGDFVARESNAGVPAEYKISSIADLNGDGKMEIVIYARYYEGNWAEVFELKNNQPAEVEELKITCGS